MTSETSSTTTRLRLILAAVLLLLTPAGFLHPYYEGPGAAWVHEYGWSLLFPLWAAVLLRIVLPTRPLFFVCALAFLIGAIKEVLQAMGVQAEAGGGAFWFFLGGGFDPWDFVYYLVGVDLAYLIIRQLERLAAAFSRRQTAADQRRT